MSSVGFTRVTKRFDDVVAVDDLSLEIADREFLVLLGPSGCGKTTALRMLAGLESITEGVLRIGDRVVNRDAPSDRDIAMVFQSYALYPHMTVRRNIESPLMARRKSRLDPDERDRRVAAAADVLGLTEYLDRKPGALSGGQRQRVALARAIVRRPEVFLMDEPLSNLDAKLRTQTRLELVELWRRLETTFIYVTHDQVEAMTMATRVAVICDGRLQQVGAPQDVYDRPANLFVATFIGSPPMNIVAGRLDGDGGVALAGGHIVGVDHGSGASGADVVVGVRPEDITIGGDDLDANVVAVEMLGHERHVVCQVGSARWVARQDSTEPMVSPGEPIRIGVVAEQLHLFDASTSERVN